MLNVLTVLSLLLFLATLVLWVRSPRYLDRLAWIGPDHEQVRALSVWTLNGKLVLTNRKEPVLGEDQPARFDLTVDSDGYSKDGAWLIEESMNTTGGQFAGFGWHPVDTDETYRVSGYMASGGDLLMPFWFVAGALAVLPVLWLRRRRTAVRPGHCPT
jgi:hypothetical protein